MRRDRDIEKRGSCFVTSFKQPLIDGRSDCGSSVSDFSAMPSRREFQSRDLETLSASARPPAALFANTSV
jgi:hypothetical protein